jgi:Putative abortive phage resistance protein AbiGi, antitoxin
LTWTCLVKRVQLDVMQHARVCFTDIPEKMLSAHCQEYGRFGVGFSRKTILKWGGNPVLYFPNHPVRDTLETSMQSMLYCLHRASPLMGRLKECLAEINASRPLGQRDMDGENGVAFIEYIDQFAQSVQRMLSFVKVMSSKRANDYHYLYEREWRIVDGAMIQQVDTTRELTDEEYQEFAAKCVQWTKPLKMSESLFRKHEHKSMLQFFRFFDGLPAKTVSQAMEVILVPSDAIKCRVAAYIAHHAGKFCPYGPAIRIFGES